MFSSTADILNISLAIGFAFIAVFLCVTLWYLVFLLRDIAETARIVRRVAEQVDELILRPMTFVGMALGQVSNVLSMLSGLGDDEPKKKKRSRKK